MHQPGQAIAYVGPHLGSAVDTTEAIPSGVRCPNLGMDVLKRAEDIVPINSKCLTM